MDATVHPVRFVSPRSGDTSLADRLRRNVDAEVLFDKASRGRYATDASIYQVEPIGVIVPRSEQAVRAAFAIAAEEGVPVLPRGAGSSQCGQTVGAALVIDGSKYLNGLVELDVAARRAVVQPGLVLDALNAKLRPHGLWFPVDVSTSAQATLGGMAGNNSCGSRSIAYGNMVHNVAGASAWLSDGELVDFGPVSALGARASDIALHVRQLAKQHASEIAERWPKVMRRVAGYNLDIFDNQSEKPYTNDGSVNLAHLLIGAEGTLAYTRSLTLKLAELPRAKVLGIVNFPSFHAAMDAAQHIVKLGPTAVELVDRTMIELSLANPAFKSTVETALIGRPAAILLVEFSGSEKARLLPKLKDLADLMGELGLPGSVVQMPED
ncbi:MAG TPA: FAD-binding oxidoreductase, partial [Burkholderiales bacterium]|nr:FAD-binding oxidoreductase [Burkholderiales bacterium]